VLSYLGLAAATGQIIDIPVIIRSLSRDFYFSAIRNNYSIPLDRDFLLAMDVGIIPVAGTHIENFDCAWWDFDGAKSNFLVNDNEILNINNIDACLAFHRHQISLLPVPERYVIPLESKPSYIWKPDASAPITPNDSCKRCRLYRAVAMGTLDDHRDIRNQIQGMETMFSTLKNQTLRRSSGFNQLFEYLSIKEQRPAGTHESFDSNLNPVSEPDQYPISAPDINPVDSLPPIASSKSKRGKKVAGRRAVASAVRQEAFAEVKRLQNIPCLKWTWGANMDESDLPALRRSIDMPKGLPNSGYDRSLSQGSDTRTSSTLTYDVEGLDQDYFSEEDDDVSRPVPNLSSKDIPPALYMNLRKRPSRYLVGLRDLDDVPMDAVPDPGTAAVPFVVPPPVSARMSTASQIEECKSSHVFVQGLYNNILSTT
jgi:hypothetical protein